MMDLLSELKKINEKNKLNNKLKLKIVCTDGEIVEGPYGGYTQALDNDPEIASISIKRNSYNVELDETEIKSIEVIE